MKKGKLIINIIATVLLTLALITMFLTYVDMPFDNVKKIADKNYFLTFTGENIISDLAEELREPLSIFFDDKISGVKLVSTMNDKAKTIKDDCDNDKQELKESNMYKVTIYARVALITAWSLAAITIALLWILKGKKKYIIAIVTSAISFILMLLMIVIVPKFIQTSIETSINIVVDKGDQLLSTFTDFSLSDTFSSYQDGLTKVISTFVSKVFIKSFSVGFWMFLVVSFLAMISNIIGLVFEVKDQKMGNVVKAVKSLGKIIGIGGDYNGAEIEIGDGIIIGRDPDVAQLVVNGEKASRKHCSITFDETINKYIVTDFNSTNGTYIVGEGKIDSNVPVELSKGTTISIGRNGDKFKLS